MTENKYCAYPFNEIYSDNTQRYRLCCFATPNKTLGKYDATNTLPFDYFMSDEMEQIRQDMMEGKRIQGCEYCYKLEDKGQPSPRTHKYNKKYSVHTATVKDIDLKLRIGGSLCNLGCYMCIPYNSSFRRQELKQSGIKTLWDNAKGSSYNAEDLVPGIGYSFDDNAKNVSTKRFNEIVDNIVDNIDKVRSIKFIGGEPIIIPRMWEIMDRIPTEAAKDIHVTFQTNLTNLSYNNYHVFDIPLKFKSLDMSVSLDHYGKKLSWIRYPIDVKILERNLIEAREHIGSITCTSSLLNVNDLFEIRNHYREVAGLETYFHNIVVNPPMLSCKNAKNKEELLEKYIGDDFEMLRSELKKDFDKQELQQGMEYCLSLSKHRNIDFQEIFSDVAGRVF
jgi:organic radical activating enzyme